MHWWSLASISVISIYVLVFSIAPYIIDLSGLSKSRLSLVVITSSIGILVLSLYESGKEYLVKSERFVMCARDLGKMLRKMDYTIRAGGISSENVEAYIGEYNQVLEKYAQNHERYDYEYFKAKYSDRDGEEFDITLWEYCWYRINWNMRIYWKPVVFLTLPLVLLALLLV